MSVITAAKTRREMAGEEATKDPIYLLQRKFCNLVEEPPGYEAIDCENWNLVDRDACHDPDKELPEEASHEEIVELFPDCVVVSWDTESVWYSRDEAEDWGKSHAYRFTYGWRVFCVPCEGQLAKILAANETLVERLKEDLDG